MKIAFKDNKILTLGGKTFSLVAGVGPMYVITVSQVSNGTISADRSIASVGDLVTLSSVPSSEYRLQYYTVDGSQIQGSSFLMPARFVTVSGSFERYIFNVSVTQPSGGTVTSNKSKAEAGETVTLSNNPDTDYQFDHYTVNGSTIAGSTFSMPAQDTVVSGVFTAIPSYNITISQSTGGIITANKQTARAGETITLSISLSEGYTLDHYTVNGSTIQGNTFTMPSSDVTVGCVLNSDFVQIGTQKWSKSFLEYTDGGEGITIKNGIYHYTNAAMLRIASSIPGWHIPTRAEVNTLLNYVGNDATSRFNALASTTGWTYGGGTNSSGFNGKPNSNGKAMFCWTTSKHTGSWWYYFYLHHEILYETDYYNAEVYEATLSQMGSCPIRMIKDA